MDLFCAFRHHELLQNEFRCSLTRGIGVSTAASVAFSVNRDKMNFRLTASALLRPVSDRLQAWPDFNHTRLMSLRDRRLAGGIGLTHVPHSMVKSSHAFRIPQ